MARISRHELKTDEFVSGMDAAYEYYLQHQRAFLTALTVVLVIAGLGLVGYSWQKHRSAQAEGMLAAALDTYHAPVGTPTAPGQTSFSSSAQRAQAAQKLFQKVSDSYPHTFAAQVGAYYVGLTQADAGDLSAAEKTLQDVSAHADTNVQALAHQALAQLYAQQGKLDLAQGELRPLIGAKSETVPSGIATFELAQLEQASTPADATKLYQQLKKDYPNSSLAAQADQQLATLNSKR